MENEQEEEEISPEKKKKQESIKKKARELMQEMAEEMIDDEILELSEKKVRQFLKDESLPYSLTTLKAVLVGFGWACATAMDSDGQKLTSLICACIQRQVTAMKKVSVKPEMDSIIERSMNKPTIKPDEHGNK
jgi:hypothetical protein